MWSQTRQKWNKLKIDDNKREQTIENLKRRRIKSEILNIDWHIDSDNDNDMLEFKRQKNNARVAVNQKETEAQKVACANVRDTIRVQSKRASSSHYPLHHRNGHYPNVSIIQTNSRHETNILCLTLSCLNCVSLRKTKYSASKIVSCKETCLSHWTGNCSHFGWWDWHVILLRQA